MSGYLRTCASELSPACVVAITRRSYCPTLAEAWRLKPARPLAVSSNLSKIRAICLLRLVSELLPSHWHDRYVVWAPNQPNDLVGNARIKPRASGPGHPRDRRYRSTTGKRSDRRMDSAAENNAVGRSGRENAGCTRSPLRQTGDEA
jgi:hypothetical protein